MSEKLLKVLDKELFIDAVAQHVENKPLLAHYSSISVIETILREKRLWFSNPLFMNDFEEFKHGMSLSLHIIRNSPLVEGLSKRNKLFQYLQPSFQALAQHYDENFAENIYIACFSEHDKDDNDGMLSMWRAYGAEGAGAALVFDSGSLAVEDASPIIVVKVKYLKPEARQAMIENAVSRFCEVAEGCYQEEIAMKIISLLFNTMKLYALSSKNWGFREENEWRAIYFPERDWKKQLSEMIGYYVGPYGIEPKLKLLLEPLAGAVGNGIQFEHSLQKIILGPTRSSKSSKAAFTMMLRKNKLDFLVNRLEASSIPLRDKGQFG